MDLKEINNYIDYLTKLRSTKFGTTTTHRDPFDDLDSKVEDEPLVNIERRKREKKVIYDQATPLSIYESPSSISNTLRRLSTNTYSNPIHYTKKKYLINDIVDSSGSNFAINTGIYKICDISIGVYYYSTHSMSKTKVTPANTAIMERDEHEGPYHLHCKIMEDQYSDYNIDENQVTQKNSFSRVDVIIDKDYLHSVPDDIDIKVLISYIFCVYLSLRCRIENTIDRIYRNKTIDHGHRYAIEYKIHIIYELVYRFSDKIHEICRNFIEIMNQNIGKIDTFHNIHLNIIPNVIHTNSEINILLKEYRKLPKLHHNMCSGKQDSSTIILFGTDSTKRRKLT